MGNSDTFPTAYSSSRYDKGKEVEHNVYQLLLKLGAAEMTKDDEKSGKKFNGIAVRLTDDGEDWHEKKGDLVIYQPEFGYYFHFDLTTSKDPKVLKDKYDNARKNDLIVTEVHADTVRNALQGSERDKDIIKSLIREGMKGFIIKKGLKRIL